MSLSDESNSRHSDSRHSDSRHSDIGRSDSTGRPPPAAAAATRFGAAVDAVVDSDRRLAREAAERAELIDRARQAGECAQQTAIYAGGSGWSTREINRRVLVSELACALRLPERSTETLIAESQALVHELRDTLASLRDGSISYRHAKALIDQAWSLPKEARAAFEAAVLPDAQTLTVAKFAQKARQVREHTHPESITARHVAAAGDREVQLQPGQDGMAWLGANLPVDVAQAGYNRITDTAIRLQGPTEPRTLTQLRADVFGDLIIDGVTPTGLGKGIRAQVQVTVPVLTLLGQSEEPGSLDGYGPIDPDTARRLAAKAPSFTRLLTHPETGVVLSVGRDRYTVPKDLRRWLQVRDQTCRFPGCGRAAVRCDLDHALDWQFNGRTRHDNLACLCPRHHKLKSESAWRVKHAGNGVLDWTSPSGRRYRTDPGTRIRPALPTGGEPPF